MDRFRVQGLVSTEYSSIDGGFDAMQAQVSGEASSDWKFLEFAGFGEFMVPIQLGTPPQEASIIIDTGSDLTWIQSQPCNKCYTQADPIFDPSKSSTYN